MALKYSITHNGNTWNSSTDLDTIALSNGSVTSSITEAGTRTLNCKGLVAANNIVIGDKTLNCAGKIMADNIVIVAESSFPTPKANLEAYTWAEIKQLSNALVAGTITTSDLSSTYNISLGSTKTSTINDESHTYRIIGFKHDVDASDNTLGMTFEQVELMNSSYAMKSSMASSDSYTNSNLKTTLDGFSIASDLSAVITAAKKTVATSVSAGTATTFTAKLWPIAEKEIAGTTSYSKCTTEGTEYEYYVNEGSTATGRIKYKSGTATIYWLRSPYFWSSGLFGFSGFANVVASGNVSGGYTGFSYGVSPCFCI